MTRVGASSSQDLYKLVQQKKQVKNLTQKDVAEVESAILKDGKVEESEVDLLNELTKDRLVLSDKKPSTKSSTITSNARFEAQSARGRFEGIKAVKSLADKEVTPELIKRELPKIQSRIKDLNANKTLFEKSLKETQDPERQKLLAFKIEVASKELSIFEGAESRLQSGSQLIAEKKTQLASQPQKSSPKTKSKEPVNPGYKAVNPSSLTPGERGEKVAIAQQQTLDFAKGVINDENATPEMKSKAAKIISNISGGGSLNEETGEIEGGSFKNGGVDGVYGEGAESALNEAESLQQEIDAAGSNEESSTELDEAADTSNASESEPLSKEEELIKNIEEPVQEIQDKLEKGEVPDSESLKATGKALEDAIAHIDSQGLSEADKAKLKTQLKSIFNSESSLKDKLKALTQLGKDYQGGLKELYDTYLKAQIPEKIQNILGPILEKGLSESNQDVVFNALETFADGTADLKDLKAVSQLLEVYGDEIKGALTAQINENIQPPFQKAALKLLDIATDKTKLQTIMSSLDALSNDTYDMQDLKAINNLLDVVGVDLKVALTEQINAKTQSPVKDVALKLVDIASSPEKRAKAIQALDTLSNDNYGLEDLEALGMLAEVLDIDSGKLGDKLIETYVTPELQDLAKAFVKVAGDKSKREKVLAALSTLTDNNLGLKDLRAIGDLADEFGDEFKQLVTPLVEKNITNKELKSITLNIINKTTDKTFRDKLLTQLDTLADGKWELQDLGALVELDDLFENKVSDLLKSYVKNIPPKFQKLATQVIERVKQLSAQERASIISSFETLANDSLDHQDLDAINTLSTIFQEDLSALYSDYIEPKLPDSLKGVVGEIVKQGSKLENRETIIASLKTLLDGKAELKDLQALVELGGVFKEKVTQFFNDSILPKIPDEYKELAGAIVKKVTSLKPEQRQAIIKSLQTLSNEKLDLKDVEAVAALAKNLDFDVGAFVEKKVLPKIPQKYRGIAKDVASRLKELTPEKLERVVKNLTTLSDSSVGVEDLEAGIELAEDLELDLKTFYKERIRPNIPTKLQSLSDSIVDKGLDKGTRDKVIKSLSTLSNKTVGVEDIKALGALAEVFKDDLQSLYDSQLKEYVPEKLEGIAKRFIQIASDPEQRETVINSLNTLTNDDFDLEDLKAAANLTEVFGPELKAFVEPIIKDKLSPELQPVALSVLNKVLDSNIRKDIFDSIETLTDGEYELKDLKAIAKLAASFGDEAEAILKPAIDKLSESNQKVALVILNSVSDPAKSGKILKALERLTGDHQWDLSDGSEEEYKDLQAVFSIAEAVGVDLAKSGLIEKLVSKFPGVSVSYDESAQTLDISLERASKSGRGGSVKASYNFEKGTYGVNLQAGAYDTSGEENKVKVAGSVGIKLSDKSAGSVEGENTAVIKNKLSDLPAALKSRLETAAKAYGIDPKDVNVVFEVSYNDDGTVTTKATLEAKTSDKPERYMQLELALDANVQELAEEAVVFLAKKYGPALAAKLGTVGLGALSKTIPVAGQLLTAAQVGWEVGRFLGENVTIGDKTIDQHMQDYYRGILEGEFADSEAKEGEFKAGLAALRNARRDLLDGNPTKNPPIEAIPEGPNRELVKDLFAVKLIAYTAMARPDSLTVQDRDQALAKVAELAEKGVLTEQEAENLTKSLNLKKGSSGQSNAEFEKIQEKEYKHLSSTLHEIRDNASSLPFRDGADDIAIKKGRDIVKALRNGKISAKRADLLFKEIKSFLTQAKVSEGDIKSVFRHIANLDQDGSENRASNTTAIEVGAAEWIEGSRAQLNSH